MGQDPFYQKSERLLLVKEEAFHKDPLLIAGMTTRRGGTGSFPYESLNMAFHAGEKKERVLRNREQIADELGFSLNKWVAAEQVHKDHIMKVSLPDKGKGAFSQSEAVGEADGLYTNERGVLLVSFYADCVPLLFYAPSNGYVGLAHAGWKGTSLNIGEKMVKKWVEKENVNREDMYVVIGPSISSDVYEVDDRVIGEMKHILPKGSPVIPWRSSRKDHWKLDLKEMNKLLLADAGIPLDHIFVSSHCTYQEESLFFSYRRDKGKTGRMMTFIGFQGKKRKGDE